MDRAHRVVYRLRIGDVDVGREDGRATGVLGLAGGVPGRVGVDVEDRDRPAQRGESEGDAWFSGHNTRDGRSWTTRSQVVDAEPAHRFGFVVGGAAGDIMRWDWTFLAFGDGTELCQSWRVLRYDPVLGATPSDVQALRDYMARSAETTLVELSRWISMHHGQTH